MRVLLGCAVLAVVAFLGGAATAPLSSTRDADLAMSPAAGPAEAAPLAGAAASPAHVGSAADLARPGAPDAFAAAAASPPHVWTPRWPGEEWPGQQRPVQRPTLSRPGGPYEFYFTRGVYCCGSSWRTDWPKADEQFVHVLQRLIDIDVSPEQNAIRLDDPELRRYPFLYVLEVGGMRLTDAEVEGLRNYLLAGGFLVVDDFWGSWQWANFEREIRRVFPDREIEDVPLSHPIFNLVYPIEEIIQVPAINVWRGTRQTSEQDGYVPFVKGIFDDAGRLMVLINGNTDLGDAWEWAEQPDYPLAFSTYAFRMGVNFIVYAMSY